jgi:aminoglycoside phosphotransferase (APT) family kinase protein
MQDISTTALDRLRPVAAAFRVEGELRAAWPLEGGLINTSLVGEYAVDGEIRRYLHQRLNTRVFADPAAVMDNLRRVTAHLHRRLAARAGPEPGRRALALVPARDGRPFWVDAGGRWWRTYPFIDGTRRVSVVDGPALAYRAARAFGGFVGDLADLPGPPLAATLPGLHDTPRHLAALEDMATRDPCGRLAGIRREVDAALAHAPLAQLLEGLTLPPRAVHNDTKVDNVLFDAASGEALCVVDLDTVMPGTPLHDFGDLVRSAVSPVAEDAIELSAVGVRLPIFAALVRGYLEGAGSVLTQAERALLHRAGALLAFELALRFLTDHLAGDRYFRVQRPDHNLHRARNQLRLLAELERQAGRLRDIVARAGEPDRGTTAPNR